MPAIVRVKRRIDEEPLSALVINAKRRRLEKGNTLTTKDKGDVSTLLRFAGTVNEQDDKATTRFACLSMEQAKESVLQKTRKPFNITEKSREEMRQHQQEQRFRVVNCARTTFNKNSDNAKAKEITIVDIEKHPKSEKTNDVPTSGETNLAEASTSAAASAGTIDAFTMSTDADTGYVYDVYVADNEQQADLMDENHLSVEPYDDNFSAAEDYDSEDSNEENYYANEYPEDDVEEYYDEDTRRRTQSFMSESPEDSVCDEYNDSSSENGYQNSYHDPYAYSFEGEELDDEEMEGGESLDCGNYESCRLKRIQPETGSVDDVEYTDDDDYIQDDMNEK